MITYPFPLDEISSRKRSQRIRPPVEKGTKTWKQLFVPYLTVRDSGPMIMSSTTCSNGIFVIFTLSGSAKGDN